ncbi:MAG: alpha/beta hydrolase [Candidatus Adiutrix sp.]|jgi:pimeloyl-ACP methyl ester carboxylesterase|nr:alpha/beta hydrolase [Candidatus Adiutrix sp.]
MSRPTSLFKTDNQSRGLELFHEKRGAGPPLILLHGNGEDHHIFDRIAPRLAAHFTVYALDSRNHGQSPQTDDYSYEALAGDLEAFIQALGLGRVGLIGFSDGAIVALMLAMKPGRLIRKMALLGVNLKPDDFKAEIYDELKRAYAESRDPRLKMMLEQPRIELEDVGRVRVPTILIAGENDVFKPGTFAELARAMPAARLKIMAGHNHDSYIVNQDILYQDFVDFFGTGI